MTTAVSPSPQPSVLVDEPVSGRPDVLPELLLFGGVVLGHAPLLVEHFANLWTRSHYQYFPVVLIAVAYLVYDRWRYQRDATPGYWRFAGIGILVLALAILAFASWFWSPTLGAVSFALSCTACLLMVQDKVRIRNWFGIGLLVWLIVPAPMGLDARLSNYLQGVTTYVSGLLLDLMTVVNVVDGNTLILATGRLFVEEACSGIVSLMAVIACSLMIAVWQNRPLVHLVILVACGIAWAAFMNTMRIVVIGLFMVKLGIDLSKGWQHEVVGLVLFAFTLLLTLSTDRLIGFFIHPMWSGPEKIAKEKSKLVRTWNFFSALGYPVSDPDLTPEQAADLPVRSYEPGGMPITFAVVFLVAAAFSGYCYASRDSGETLVPPQLVQRTEALTGQSMPAEMSGWNLVDFQKSRTENRKLFGEYSKVWVYEKDGVTATFAVDYLFNDIWHELTVCYGGIGWELLDRVVHGQGNVPYVVADFEKGTGFGRLQYSMVTAQGRPYDPPSTQSFISLTKRRLKKGQHRLLQIQLWVTDETRLEKRQREDIAKLFVGLRGELVKSLFSAQGAR